MSTSPLGSVYSTPPSGIARTVSSGASTVSDPTTRLANEQTFLQLLVAQLHNQDPLQPQDGTQFVAQLAQFSSLEQELGIHQDLNQLVTYAQAAPPTSSTLGNF